MKSPVPIIAAILALAGACVPIEPASEGDAGVVRHSATVSESNALIAEVRVSLSRPARVFVEYDNPLAGAYRTRLGALAVDHAIPIVRLRPETNYDYTIFTVNGTGELDAVRGPGGRFTTGALPKPLASVFTSATGRSSQPLILVDYTIAKSGSYYVFWDEMGALVWYLHAQQRKHAGAVARLPGSENFIFGSLYSDGLWRWTPLGRVTKLTGDVVKWHHDLMPLDGGRVLFPMAKERPHWQLAQKVKYDGLAIWDSATGRVEEAWSAREAWNILDPAQHWEGVDSEGLLSWTHLNSVSLGGHGNLLLSVRNRSQVVSLTPDFQIEWQLHGPESDYEFPDPTDRFYKQHTASQLANGNILLFDNGNGRPDAEGGEYSRALELRLDDVAGTAVKAWEYRPQPDIYAPIVGSAYRLDSGNTLVNFGVTEGERSQAALVVVEADANGDEVLRVETTKLHQQMSRYRAQGGIDAIYGETMLRPPTAAVQRPPPVRLKPAVASTFDLYLEDGQLIYAKWPCSLEDVTLPFFLHVIPKKTYVLPKGRREFGFDNLDFNFFQRGVRSQGRCYAEVLLPEYEIDLIRTGQFVAEGEAVDGRDRSNDAPSFVLPASAAWGVEISQVP